MVTYYSLSSSLGSSILQASSQIRLRYEQGTLQSLRVFNAVGQEVLRQNLEGSEQVVNISTLAKGVYFLKIGTDRATIMRKIVVE